MAKAKPKAAKPAAAKKQPPKKRVTFKITAPDAKLVAVVGSFCDWYPDTCLLKRDGSGTWTRTMLLAPGRYEYRFVVDGTWWDDPNCSERVANIHGSHNCIVTVS